MLKNMFEQEHKSTALDLSADEVLNARLGKGAMIKSHRTAIAAAAAALVLAAGIGIFALNSGIETADPDFVAKDTSASQPAQERELSTDVRITLVNDAGNVGNFDLTDNDLRSRAQTFADSFADAPYSDLNEADVDKDSLDDYVIEFSDKKNDRALIMRMNSSNVIVLELCLGDDVETYCIDGNKHKELCELIEKCKQAGDKKLEEQLRADPYSLNVYVSDNDDVSDIDLKENSIDYSEFTGKLDSFYKAFKADTLPEGVTVEQVDGIMLKSPYLGVTMVEGNVHLEFQLAKEKGSSLYMTEYTYTGKAVESFVEYKISDNAEIYQLMRELWSKIENKKQPADDNNDDPAVTTATDDPKDNYTADEIKPLSFIDNYPEDMTVVHFRRPRDTENSQSAMSFELIDEYEDLIKGVYDSYKSGEIKPAETFTPVDDPLTKTWGTMMYVFWYDESDGGLVQLLGANINEDAAFIRLTDLDSRDDDCETGNVFYFDKQSAVYKQMKAIWDFYYPVYESVK